MKAQIAVLSGDGIGPEIMQSALSILQVVGDKFGHDFRFEHGSIGGVAFEDSGSHCPDETLELCRRSDAVLFGSVGGPVHLQHEPKWKSCEANSILALRKAFKFAVNLRPVRVLPELSHLSPLRSEIIDKGVDVLFVRELLGDVYFGEHTTTNKAGVRLARDVAEYTDEQIRVVAQFAFSAARGRRKKVASVDKANVLDTSKLWRQVVTEVSEEFPDVTLEHVLVDNCAMQLIRNPSSFDVVVTSNLFGDILSDEAAVLPGSLGLLPSASLNCDGFGLYEPSGGSAPDIAGKGIANPSGQILSAALMLRHSFRLDKEASLIERSVQSALCSGAHTADLVQCDDGKVKAVTTDEFTKICLAEIRSNS